MSQLTNTILDIAEQAAPALPPEALDSARLSLFDWLICGLAGIEEPLAEKLRHMAAHEGGRTASSVFGGGMAPARTAALVNGATSHALDYDDTHFAHVGHLSVAIYPAALAAGEETDASATDLAAAFLVGAEAAIRVGMVLGPAHYNRGFHQTATAGAFGAAVAAGRLYGLARDQMRAALGLCATRASGLKSQFGTMGKPFNAGIAAANGVECAALAGLGMTSCEDGVMGAQGFVSTHSDAPGTEIAAPDQFLFGDVKYKFHACCHGTHAMIEALSEVRPRLESGLDGIASMTLSTNPRWLKVCDIPDPHTGLEVKFSYRWLAGMVLGGQDTGAFETYSDELAGNPHFTEFARRVDVTGDPGLSDMQAEGVIVLTDGRRLEFSHDLAQKVASASLETRLRAKAHAVLGLGAEMIGPVLNRLPQMSASDLGRIVRGQA